MQLTQCIHMGPRHWLAFVPVCRQRTGDNSQATPRHAYEMSCLGPLLEASRLQALACLAPACHRQRASLCLAEPHAVQALCLRWARSLLQPFQPSVRLHFPQPLDGRSSITCSSSCEVMPLLSSLAPAEVCSCHGVRLGWLGKGG